MMDSIGSVCEMRAQSAVARRLQPAPGDAFLHDVIAGLTAQPKYLLPKYFYDAAGARLFEQITGLPEYYPTRCELEILHNNAGALARFLPTGCALIEFGSGSNRKVRLLLEAAPAIQAYVPVDISLEMLEQEAGELRRDYPSLQVLPFADDFTRSFALPAVVAGMPHAGFFPGSTIGNFEPEEAAAFLRRTARVLGRGAALIIGVDLVKDPVVLNAAYNDAAGVTARFNLNLLARINRELGAELELEAFRHYAFFDAEHQRIEMHLVSRSRQRLKLAGRTIEFRAGESIHTENSYKYTLDSFTALARGAGWSPAAVWTDAGGNFSVHALVAGDR
jgi:dimethylhistidine N-methyltransferase